MPRYSPSPGPPTAGRPLPERERRCPRAPTRNGDTRLHSRGRLCHICRKRPTETVLDAAQVVLLDLLGRVAGLGGRELDGADGNDAGHDWLLAGCSPQTTDYYIRAPQEETYPADGAGKGTEPPFLRDDVVPSGSRSAHARRVASGQLTRRCHELPGRV